MQLRWAFLRAACWIAIVTGAGCAPKETEKPEDPGSTCDPNPCEQEGKTRCEIEDDRAVCACDKGLVSDGRGGCTSTDKWSTSIAGSAVNASGADQFTAHVRVVDSEDKPIQGATLRVGTRVLMTDVEGRGGFTQLPPDALSRMRISADGYVPVVRQLSIANAGLNELSVELVKEGKLQKIDAAQKAVLQDGN